MIHRIDWEDSIGKVKKCVSDGGIICVSGSRKSACNSFMKRIKELIVDEEGFSCIQFNPANEKERCTPDIIAKIESGLGITKIVPKIGEVNVASHINAGGDVNISGINVVLTSDGVSNSIRQIESIKLIHDRINDLYCEGRKVAFLLGSWHEMPKEVIDWFYEVVWVENLERLASKGLIVICSYYEEEGERLNGMIGGGSGFLRLPDEYVGVDRERACDDIANCMVVHASIENSEAKIRADQMLRDYHNHPSAIHDNLSFVLAGLREG